MVVSEGVVPSSGRAGLRGWLAGPAGRPTGRASWARARGRREQAGASRAWGVGAGLGREERVGLGSGLLGFGSWVTFPF